MGSGKTTLGLALAHAASLPFIDLDDYIEERAGMSITEIFRTCGEEKFRSLERRALEEVSRRESDGLIVACGGGTPCREGNMELMNDCGLTVWLDTSLPVYMRRLSVARMKRPLIAALNDDELRQFIADKLAERQCHYAKAAARFDSTLLETPQEVAHSVKQFITEFL